MAVQKRRQKDFGENLGGQDLNLSDRAAPLRIIIGGPPHSGKSTLMHLLENKFNEYHVPVELVDMDLSAPTDLRSKEGFTRTRDKRDWTLDLAREAQQLFEDAGGSEVVLGDSVGLISSITEILSQPADVAILIASGNKGDDHNVYRKVINKWKDFFGDLRKPLLVVVRSSMNPDDMSMFDPHDNYGVIVGLDRKAFEDGLINPQDACVEGIVFEIAQAFDLTVSSSPTSAHLERIQDKWPSVKDIDTWTPEKAPNLTPEKRQRLSKIERDYFRERENKDFVLGDDYRNRQAESFHAEVHGFGEEGYYSVYEIMELISDNYIYAGVTPIDWREIFTDYELEEIQDEADEMGEDLEEYLYSHYTTRSWLIGEVLAASSLQSMQRIFREYKLPYRVEGERELADGSYEYELTLLPQFKSKTWNAQMLEAKGKLWHKDKPKTKGRGYWEQKSRASIRKDPDFIKAQRYFLGGIGIGILSFLYSKNKRQGEV